METLPYEAFDLIAANLSSPATGALKALRLTSRSLAIMTRPHLFQTVVLKATDESAKRFINVVNQDALKIYVKRIVVDLEPIHTGLNAGPGLLSEYTPRTQSESLWSDTSPGQVPTVPQKVLKAFERIRELQNIASAEILLGFSAKEPTREGEVYEWANWIQPLIQPFSKLLQLTRIRLADLLVVNSNAVAAFETPEFKVLVARISELDIHFVFGYSSEIGIHDDEMAAPDHILTVRFFDDVMQTWLSNSKHLKSLSLRCDNFYWGVTPKFPLSKLECPSLESLHLKQFSIHHDSQVDWLCSLKSLTHLTFDNVAIVYYRRQSDDPRWPPGYIPPPPDEVSLCYWRPWAWVYTRLGAELPQLRKFNLKISPNKFTEYEGSVQANWEGWRHRYLSLNETYGDKIAYRESYDDIDETTASYGAPYQYNFTRLEKMDLAALIRLSENLGREWTFDLSNKIGRAMLKEPEMQPVDFYGSGNSTSDDDFGYWGLMLDDFEDLDEFEKQLVYGRASNWDVVQNLVLNGVLEPVPPEVYAIDWQSYGREIYC